MEIAGYITAAFIGILLGTMGGGGSILTVPMLVYLFRMQPAYATSYSLFIVGFTSLTGAMGNYLKGLVHIRTAILFGLSSFITVFAVRKWVMPVIPETIVQTPYFVLTQSALTMILFALLMVVAAISMLQNKNKESKNSDTVHAQLPVVKLLLYGTGIGIVTGLLGAGGGFLLIPVLVLLLHLPMKEAVGTSLLIISINSLIGFAGDIGHYSIEWRRLLLITTISVAGIFAGVALSQKISAQKLKKAFGWFVLLMGIFILAKEIMYQS
ncbi:MAG: sulfite exporter TauE/SafE family protein [Chitinophagaceae bacterium]|nr:sulfite exporter TauE/SafE family protein [Chitinophagaceae bacterium]